MKQALAGLSLSGSNQIWTRVEEVPGLGRWHRVFIGRYEEREDCDRTAELVRGTGQVGMARVRRVTPPSP
jgi:hypothetical protein